MIDGQRHWTCYQCCSVRSGASQILRKSRRISTSTTKGQRVEGVIGQATGGVKRSSRVRWLNKTLIRIFNFLK